MMSTRTCKVGLVQMRCSTDAEQNLREAMDGARHAAELGADIVCLPELFRTPYFCQSEDHANFALAESIPGPTSEAMA